MEEHARENDVRNRLETKEKKRRKGKSSRIATEKVTENLLSAARTGHVMESQLLTA